MRTPTVIQLSPVEQKKKQKQADDIHLNQYRAVTHS